MKDRIPKYAGRVKLTPVEGQENVYDLERKDEPTQEGTPLNKKTLLSSEVQEMLELDEDATPSDALAALVTKAGKFEDGEGENSLTVRDRGNKVLTNFSISTGLDSVSGSRGFRIIGKSQTISGDYIDKLTLQLDEYDGGFEVGDIVSIRISSNFDKYGTIEEINGNSIVIMKNEYSDNDNEMPTQELVENPVGDQNTVRAVEKPAVGNVHIGKSATSEGRESYALGMISHAEGYDTWALGKYSHAEGCTTESVYAAHAEGQDTHAIGQVSHTEGAHTWATGNTSHAEGHKSVAHGFASHAEGHANTASSSNAHAEGSVTKASGISSHSEGYNTEASRDCAHAEGYMTNASGNAAHAEGKDTLASGYFSHAEGNSRPDGTKTEASGIASHAEGTGSKASGNAAHAEGVLSQATGDRSHAEGGASKALEFACHAEGGETEARSPYSHTGGYKTIAASQFQSAIGKFNQIDENSKYLFIVGNGSSELNRSNAFAVGFDGMAEAKSVKIGDTELNETKLKEIINKNYVENAGYASTAGSVGGWSGSDITNGFSDANNYTDSKVEALRSTLIEGMNMELADVWIAIRDLQSAIGN